MNNHNNSNPRENQQVGDAQNIIIGDMFPDEVFIAREGENNEYHGPREIAMLQHKRDEESSSSTEEEFDGKYEQEEDEEDED